MLAEGRHILGCRPKPRAGHSEETGNRARKVSGTHGRPALALEAAGMFLRSAVYLKLT